MPGFTSLTQSLFSKVNERKASASLQKLGSNGAADGKPLRFQYWPESIQDTKVVNWAPRDIPGGSLPLYQWINSGERIISFTAVFSCDMDLIQGEDKLVERLEAVGQAGRNVDIRGAAIWLREFMLPGVGELEGSESPISLHPAKILLELPKMGIGVTGGMTKADAAFDQMICIMTTCDLSYDAFFPSGLPRVMTASLSFAQIAQVGNAVVFPGNQDMTKDGGAEKSFGYKLEVTGRG